MWARHTNSVLLHEWSGRRSVSVGLWLTHGAAHDPDGWNGATHLVEHLSLRRCGARDRRELARLIDRLGGDVDAWTSSEAMGLSVQTTLDALPDALAILRDALLDPTFSDQDVDLERQVAMAELELVRDDPAEQVSEKILEAAWGGHPLARPVIGTPDSLADLTPDILKKHHSENLLRPGGIILAAVGDIPRGVLEDALGEVPIGAEIVRPKLTPPTWSGSQILLDKPATDQVHVRLAFPACSASSTAAIAYSVLARVLGGGNSSRLFQRLREDDGLTYDIWCEPVLRSVCGLLEIGWACSPERFSLVWSTVEEELLQLSSDLRDDEVEIVLQGMSRNLQMQAESAHGRASLDVAEVLDHDRRFDLEMALRELQSTTPDQIRELARRVLRLDDMASVICGPDRIVGRLGSRG